MWERKRNKESERRVGRLVTKNPEEREREKKKIQLLSLLVSGRGDTKTYQPISLKHWRTDHTHTQTRTSGGEERDDDDGEASDGDDFLNGSVDGVPG